MNSDHVFTRPPEICLWASKFRILDSQVSCLQWGIVNRHEIHTVVVWAVNRKEVNLAAIVSSAVPTSIAAAGKPDCTVYESPSLALNPNEYAIAVYHQVISLIVAERLKYNFAPQKQFRQYDGLATLTDCLGVFLHGAR